MFIYLHRMNFHFKAYYRRGHCSRNNDETYSPPVSMILTCRLGIAETNFLQISAVSFFHSAINFLQCLQFLRTFFINHLNLFMLIPKDNIIFYCANIRGVGKLSFWAVLFHEFKRSESQLLELGEAGIYYINLVRSVEGTENLGNLVFPSPYPTRNFIAPALFNARKIKNCK